VNVRDVAEAWGLAAHPEGGYYRETYRSPRQVTLDGWPGPRSLATSILYLLAAGERSAWHRVGGDELWLWQGGAPMELTLDDGPRLLGPDPAAGHQLQLLVPGRAWQSATPATVPAGTGWSLAACLVVPGFDFADFELRPAD
jgi:predicted cupin superfamily sugar epimerase